MEAGLSSQVGRSLSLGPHIWEPRGLGCPLTPFSVHLEDEHGCEKYIQTWHGARGEGEVLARGGLTA